MLHGRIALAWRTRVNYIELAAMFGQIFQRVGPMKLEGIMRLRLDINADNFESGAMVADPSSASAAKEIKKAFRAHSDIMLIRYA